MDTLIGIVLPYVSVVLFLVGASYRVASWMTAPKKLNWKLYPAPEDLVGEAQYILEEWMSFKTLFRHNRTVWLGSYGFHLSLVALMVWFILFLVGLPLPWLVRAGGTVLLASSVYLLLVRLFNSPMRAMSTPVEYFNLTVFALIALTGLSLLGDGLGSQTRAYFLGLLSLQPIAPPANGILLWHLLLLEFVLAYLPFSKMFHIASKYFAYHKLRWTNPYEVSHRTS